MHYCQSLKTKLPYSPEKSEHDKTATSVNDSELPIHVRSLKKFEEVLIFSLSNGNNHFFFEDGTSMFFSLSSYFVSYRAEESLLIHSIPLDFKSLEPAF